MRNSREYENEQRMKFFGSSPESNHEALPSDSKPQEAIAPRSQPNLGGANKGNVCPTCEGRGYNWRDESSYKAGDKPDFRCITCKGAGKIPEVGGAKDYQANQKAELNRVEGDSK